MLKGSLDHDPKLIKTSRPRRRIKRTHYQRKGARESVCMSRARKERKRSRDSEQERGSEYSTQDLILALGGLGIVQKRVSIGYRGLEVME